jgi:hypothetical protein
MSERGNLTLKEIKQKMTALGVVNREWRPERDGGGKTKRPPLVCAERDSVIVIGSVVLLHSLQSPQGKLLNEKRAVVLAQVIVSVGESNTTTTRWKVKVEGEQHTKTTAVKAENIRFPPAPSGSHPIYLEMVHWATTEYKKLGKRMEMDREYRDARGVTYDDDPPTHRARKLVELLDKPSLVEKDGYTPNQTILVGEALKFYGAVGESNLAADCNIHDLEHIAGFLALAAMCQGEKSHAKGCGDGVPEAVMFAFLEAAPTSLDVLMELLVATPYIGPEHAFQGDLKQSFRKRRSTNNSALTPDQASAAYCHAMKGPIAMLCFIGQFLNSTAARVDVALFHRLERHKLFPLVIQRLFRIAAREGMGTEDGKVLGRYVRTLLAHLSDLDGDLDAGRYKLLCYGNGNDVFERSALIQLLREENIKSNKDLLAFLKRIIPQSSVERFLEN